MRASLAREVIKVGVCMKKARVNAAPVSVDWLTCEEMSLINEVSRRYSV